MFQSGLQRLHLRKPGSTIENCRSLLREIPSCYHSRIVLHDHFALTNEFSLFGVHLNSRNPEPPAGWHGSVSRSCHSIEEVARYKDKLSYLTLSPIFDSISKQGYNAAFTEEELSKARADGIIDPKVYALGGVTFERLDEVSQMGFGGGVILGDAWKESLPVVLTIAGSDTSAGAGIQQDLKTMTRCGCYGATVISALTSQNTIGVQHVMPVPASVVESQLESIFSDMDVRAVKIGMIPNREVAEVIVKVLNREKAKRIMPIICDPVMISTSGTRLMTEDCIGYIVEKLFPLCTLVTPNIPEYEYLCNSFTPQQIHCTNLLLKGGHGNEEQLTDTLHLHDTGETLNYSSQRIDSHNLHGTGCTLSSAIASFMARRQSLNTAVSHAKEIMNEAITGGRNLTIGHGNGPLWSFNT